MALRRRIGLYWLCCHTFLASKCQITLFPVHKSCQVQCGFSGWIENCQSKVTLCALWCIILFILMVCWERSRGRGFWDWIENCQSKVAQHFDMFHADSCIRKSPGLFSLCDENPTRWRSHAEFYDWFFYRASKEITISIILHQHEWQKN